MNPRKYLFGYEYERMCRACVYLYGIFTFAIDYGEVGCIPCLTEMILKQRKVFRGDGVT